MKSTSRKIAPAIEAWACSFVLITGLGFSLQSYLNGQEMEATWRHARVQVALEAAARLEGSTIETQIELCQIPAPPFKEAKRAEAYAELFRQMGLENVTIDSEGNVLASMESRSARPRIVVSAHLDTVFPEGTDVRVKRVGATLVGPGIVDDCRGLAVVYGVPRAIAEAEVPLLGTIVFVGTVGEEGEGNLRGVRHLFEKKPLGEIDAFISVDGAGYDLTHRAVGSERYRVNLVGPGGHSFGAFGLPNPIHAMGRAIALLSDLEVPADPKTTFNVGVIEGGTSVNSIPFQPSMLVDLRSVDPAALANLVSRFKIAMDKAVTDENDRWNHPQEKVAVELETIGIRPAGRLSVEAPIVQLALSAAKKLDISARLNAASTDANIPINLGIPAITIDGGGQGRGAHSPNKEIFELRDSYLGTQWALLLSVGLAGAVPEDVH